MELSKLDSNTKSIFDILYDGFEEYRRKVQGWPCPSRDDIEDWEAFKVYIFTRLDEKQGNNHSTSSGKKKAKRDGIWTQ